MQTQLSVEGTLGFLQIIVYRLVLSLGCGLSVGDFLHWSLVLHFYNRGLGDVEGDVTLNDFPQGIMKAMNNGSYYLVLT